MDVALDVLIIVTSLVSLYYSVVGRRACFGWGIANYVLMMIASFLNQLYGTVIFYLVICIPLQLYGLFYWQDKLDKKKQVKVRRFTVKLSVLVITACAAGSLGIAALLALIPGEQQNFLDAAFNVFNLCGIILMTLRYMEAWWIYVLASTIGLIMWVVVLATTGADSGTVGMVLNNALYLGVNIYGLIAWRRRSRIERRTHKAAKVPAGLEFDGQVSLAEYTKFFAKCPASNFFQAPEMYQRYKKTGKEAYLVGVRQKGKSKRSGDLVAAAIIVQMSTRRLFGREQKLFAALRGPLLDYDAPDAAEILTAFTNGARELLRTKGGAALRISPNAALRPRDNDGQITPGPDHLALQQHLQDVGYKDVGEYGLGKWLYVLDTAGRSQEEIFHDFRKGLRYSIKWAENRYGVTTRTLKKSELAEFFQILERTEQRQGFHEQRSPQWCREVYDSFGKKVQFVLAEVELDAHGATKVPIAAAMFSLAGPEILYIVAGSEREHQKYGGASLILWQMIKHAVDHGYQRVNLYGARPVRGNKLFEFKRGFHGRVEELMGTYILPLNLYGKLYATTKKYQEYNSDLA